MKRSMNRAVRTALATVIGFSALPLLAQTDYVLPTIGFEDTPDSVNLANFTGMDGQPLFTATQISDIPAGSCFNNITEHSFKTGVDPMTADPEDDVETAENSSLVLIRSCEIAGQGAVKILTLEAERAADSSEEEGVAKISITSGTNNDAVTKVIGQKVLHHIKAKSADRLRTDNPCGIDGDPLVATMSIRVDTCNVTQLFVPQITRTGLTFEYEVVGAMQADPSISPDGVSNTYRLLKLNDFSLLVRVDALQDGVKFGPIHQNPGITLTGIGGLSDDGLGIADESSRTNVVLGQTLAEVDITTYFEFDPNNGEVEYAVTPVDGLETTLVVRLDRSVNLTVKGIAVGIHSLTITATQSPTSGDPVTVELVSEYEVRDTQIFSSLTLSPAQKWVEETTVDLDATDGLNDLIASNVTATDPDTGNKLELTYTVTSVPMDLFEVEQHATSGAPVLSWAQADQTVPSYEDHQKVVIKLTATPDEDDGEVMTINVYIEDTDDQLDVTDCTSNELAKVYLRESQASTVGYEGAIAEKITACVSDEDSTFTGAITAASNPASDYTLNSEGNVTQGIYAKEADGLVVVTTASETTAGTSNSTVTVTVTVTNDATPPQTQEVDYTFDVVMLTGANTPPRFPGGASQVMVSVKETAEAGKLVGPPYGDTWQASDVNETSNDDGDMVTHSLANDGTGTGYCLVANEITGTVRTGECGIDAESVPSNPFSVNLIAEDRFGGTATLEVVITVENIPESPERNDIALPMSVDIKSGDAPFTLDLDTYFDDPEGVQLEYDAQSNDDTVVVLTEGTDGVIFLTSGANSGSTTITVKVTGPVETGETLPAPIEIPVTNFILADNTSPIFSNGLASVEYSIAENAEDGKLVGVPFAVTNGAPGSHEANFDKLTYSIEGSVAFKVSNEADDLGQMMVVGGMLDYDQRPEEEFNLKVTDRFGKFDTLRVKINIEDANEPPIVTAAGMAIPPQLVVEGGSTTLNVRPFFDDPDEIDKNRLFIIPEVSIPNRVRITIDADDVAQLEGLETGAVKVTLTARDSASNEVSTMFDLTVVVNSAPTVANGIDDQSLLLAAIVDIPLDGVFTDPNLSIGDSVSVTAVSSSNEESVVAALNGDNTAVTIIGRAIGTANVTVTATDSAGATVSDVFAVTVAEEEPPEPPEPPEPENQAPTLDNPISGIIIVEGNSADVDLINTFSDPDDDDLTLSAVSSDDAVASAGAIGADNILTVTAGTLPDGARYAIADITVTAEDPEGAMASDKFSVVVLRDNSTPTVLASIEPQNVTRGAPIRLDVSGVFVDDDEGDELTIFALVDNVTIASAVLDNGMISLTLDGLAPGDTAVTLTAMDLMDASVSTSFDVTVDTRPEIVGPFPPIALEIGGDGYELSLDGLFRDDDGDALNITTSLSSTGIVTENLSGMMLMLSPTSRGNTSLTVTATDDTGYSVSVTGSIAVGDGEIRKVAQQSLAGYGRSVLSSVSASMETRLLSGSQYSDLSFASNVDTGSETESKGLNTGSYDVHALTPELWSTSDQPMNSNQNALSALGLSGSQSFSMKLNRAEGIGALSVWGTTDRQNFDGTGFEGTTSNTYLGVDLRHTESLMFGVAVARNSGEMDYSYGSAEQSMDTNLSTVLPYFRYDLDPVTTVWGVAGIGDGDVDSSVVGASNETSDLSMDMVMLGGRRGLSRLGKVDLALRGDLAIANLTTESGNGAVDGLEAGINRLRAGLEGSYTFDMYSGLFTPFANLSMRHDGGDGEVGTGVEISGGFRMNVRAFNVEARGRMFESNGADRYSENGFTLMATLNPAADGSGFSFTLAPRWGGSALDTGAMWAESGSFSQGQRNLGSSSQGSALEAKIGFGKRVLNERFMLIPFVDVDMASDDSRQYLVGARLDQLIKSSADFDLDFAIGREERRSTGKAGMQFGFSASLRF